MSEKSCAGCGTANEADARFCEGCGSALDRRCSACGMQASATARFCRSCGGSLDGSARPVPAAGPTRKTVTVMFADLAGSTTFEEKVDAETAREVMGQYHALLREIAEQHRAGVKKYIGDGFMAVWGVPEIGAADAEHAVDAAVELQDRFVGLAARVVDTHGESLGLRVAVNTGEVVVGSGDADLVGDALNVAARLESQCPLGHVVVGEETWRATRGRYRYEPLSPVQVKGRAAPVAVYQWAGQRSEPADSVPFVGRTHEFRRLQTVLEDAVARRGARLVTVIGDPGVGKTRLAAEFAGSQQGAVVLQIRCAAEGTVALAPVVEILRSRDLEADLPADVPERDRILRDLNGMTGGVAGSVEETFWALRRYFEVLAERDRLILILDDIQWADALLLDFVGHLSEWVRDVPILMVALARPELRDTRPELVTVGGWVGDAIRLGGLEPAATAELAARVLGSDQLPADLLARLPSSTGGNPLFVRELVAMLVHDGVLVAMPTGWRLTIDVDAIAVPPTIHALLASRLERMNTADRRVLETASVIGTDFSPAAVSALSGVSVQEVKAALDRLRKLELAQPSGAYSGDEPVWRFHHILIRDVAYRRLLKSDRAELHERFADWIDASRGTGVFESDEMVARHLEMAHGYRGELGSRDSHTGDLALRSARCYLSAARRALDRDALVSAGAQAARGAALASADTALRAELLLVGCEAFLSAGDVAAGAALVDELDRTADEVLKPWATCYRCQFLVYTDPSRLPEVDERLQDAIDEFARRGDHVGSAKAYRVRANARARLGRIGDCEADLFEALIAARQGSDHRQITAALGAAPNAALWGPSPAPKAGGRCLDVVRMQRMTTAAPSLEATSLRCLAVLELLRGRPDKARSMLADAREIVSELGLRHGLMETELYAGLIESMAGDPVAAEPHFRTALEGLDSLGVGADAGQAAALLARSLLAQGKVGEADRFAAESERIAGHNLKTAIGWRAVRAEILSEQGRHTEAVAMAQEAVDVAADTDLVLDYADACMTLSRVLAGSGDSRGAAQARGTGESLYAAKDAVFLVGVASEPVDAPAAAAQSLNKTARLTAVNRAIDVILAGWQSLSLEYAEGFMYDDRRKVSGEPLETPGVFIAAARRKHEQYPHVEGKPLAVRGDTLALIAMRWRDESGNETMSLDLCEIDGSDKLAYHGRFDEDDFVGAYRELEERYYAGEGAAFSSSGLKLLQFQESMWTQDVALARPIVQPDFVWMAEPSTLKPAKRTLDEMFVWRAERLRQLASFDDWLAAVRWLSPECCVLLCEMRGTGHDGEQFGWNRIYVTTYRDGLLASGREFDIAEEDAAFAYADSLVARERHRLSVSNRASAVAEGIIAALRAADVEAAAGFYAESLSYDDRRQLTGNPLASRADVRENVARVVSQYRTFETRIEAARGEKTALVWSRWSDPGGNATAYLHVFELDDDGLIRYEGRFDESDFPAAYRELEQRYYAAEGAAFAANGLTQVELLESLWKQDVEAARRATQPDAGWFAETSTLKPGKLSLEEFFAWRAGRLLQVSSFLDWQAALRWLSPECCVSLVEFRAAGSDGEDFRWNRIYVMQFRDGLLTSGHEFDVTHEDAAFAFAESRVGSRRRLSTVNRATETGRHLSAAMTAGDIDAALDQYSDSFVYDDRRRLRGYRGQKADRTIARSALDRIRKQFNRYQLHTLAIRGERLHLARYRWSEPGGNETTGLVLQEIGEDGRIVYEGRFDDDDFVDAYAELDRRYYAGEGAEFARSGVAGAGWVEGIGRRDIEMVRRFSTPDFRWFASASSLKTPERTVEDVFEWMRERGQQVSAHRHWQPTIHWLSPECTVSLVEVAGYGSDVELFAWNYVVVCEIRDGLVAAVREFDTGDEAFEFAEGLGGSRPRLAKVNRASELGHRLITHVQLGDLEAAAACYADQIEYDDRRRISGEPVVGLDNRWAAFARIAHQYNCFELHTLAVRGELLHLARHRWSDSSGNETTGLALQEIDTAGLIVYDGRFDENDFASAYAEMEKRYYQGEGAAYAEAGSAVAELALAESRGDFDGTFRMFSTPGLRIESRSQSIFPTRTPEQLRRGLEELRAMVGEYRVWSPVVCWLSPEWVVSRHEREATGESGESWSRLYVSQIQHGVFTSVCEFDVDDEEQAFQYAEKRMRQKPSRLAVSNRASGVAEAMAGAIRVGNLDLALAQLATDCVHEDRRRLRGDPIEGHVAFRAAFERIIQDYSQQAITPVAVRGDRLILGRVNRFDDAGNASAVLVVGEVDENDKMIAYITFDEDDFESAYLELERRYYAGEGSAYAEASATLIEMVVAGNRGDLDKVFGEFFTPDVRVESRSRTIIPDRTAAELRSSFEEFNAMVSWSRVWNAAVSWLSPTVVMVRQEREALGLDGGRYEWSRIYVGRAVGGRVDVFCEFDGEFEDEALAYAEELVGEADRRLEVSNRASEIRLSLAASILDGDIEGAAARYTDDLVYEDRRRLSGELPVGRAGMYAALARLRRDYSHFGGGFLAVRGQRLALAEYVCHDDAGNHTSGLTLTEIDDDGCIRYEGRFDEDDFEGAYLELERRYYDGEGAASAAAGSVLTDFVTGLNSRAMDRAFALINNPELVIENRSRAVFPDRSAAELRADLEQLLSMMPTVRWWYSALDWLSPNVCVGRQERHATGPEGEAYSWTDIYAFELDGGFLHWVCRYDLDEVQQAFADGEERAKHRLKARSRLSLSNRATEVAARVTNALSDGDPDAFVAAYRADWFRDDRRRLAGAPIGDAADMRVSVVRMLQQFNQFDWRTLAVRGSGLALGSSRSSDSGGNVSTYLHVFEVDDAGLIVYEARFDEDDFDSTYYELERRHCAGEGAPFADFGMTMADYFAVRNRGDLDTLFTSLTSPDLRMESRSHSVFVVRSAAELRASIEELTRLVGSVRDWISAVHNVSPTWAVCRYHREALGHEGQDYRWERFAVVEFRGGRLHYVCDFELDDEEAAFAYAEERSRASKGRMAVTNRACEVITGSIETFLMGNVDAAVARYRDDWIFEDRRRLFAGQRYCLDALRGAAERIITDYSHFEWQPLAVRGDRMALGWTRWRDHSGNETTHLHLVEIDADSRVLYEARYDEDDFESAYEDLDARFAAGEGAVFATSIPMQTAFLKALNRLDPEDARKAVLPSFRMTSPPTTLATEERTFGEFYAWIAERANQVPGIRHWMSVNHWLSADCLISRIEIQTLGPDVDEFTWPRLAVADIRGGRIAHIRQFEINDEDSAFTYAEELFATKRTRLPLTNIASEAAEAAIRAMQAADIDTLVDLHAADYVFDDRRRLSGDALHGRVALRAALERLLLQFNSFDSRVLAVRGDRVMLGWTRWSDAAGNQTEYLHVFETGDDGRLVYDGRFDEDDFEAAYAELERRYYAGEGAAAAESGLASGDYMAAINRGDFDTAVDGLTRPDFRLENRSRSAFPDRSVADLRASLEQLHAMVSSVRSWFSSIGWVSATTSVSRMERDAVGSDGETYAWSRILVSRWTDGRLASLCDFDADDEDAAFAFAESIVE